MNALDLMQNRHSYRGTYRNDPVPRKDLVRIMQAGLAAPSGCNKQTTSLIAVDDPDLAAKIKGVIDPPIAETAPAFICVLTRKIIAYRDRTFYVQDYSAAIENMLLEAKALGYESCWYEGHITDVDQIGRKIADLLKVPLDYELVCLLPVGRAAEAPVPVKKRMFSERAWFNGFKKKIESERSCGAVIYTEDGGVRRFVIIRSGEGLYGFPKGHIEAGETEEEAALREIREETGLNVTLNTRFRTFNEYPLSKRDKPAFLKEAVYFLAECHPENMQAMDENEISEICLMTYEQAMKALPYESSRRILLEANQYIERHQ